MARIEEKARTAAENQKMNTRLTELHPTRKNDYVFLYSLFKDPEIQRFHPGLPKPFSEKEMRKWVAKQLKAVKDKKFSWIILDKRARKPIGYCYLAIYERHKNAEIAIWLKREVQGLGIGKEIMLLLMRLGFEKFHLARIWERRLAENQKSKGLVESIGFKQEARLRKHTFAAGKLHDEYWYGILRKEWPAAKKKLERLLRVKK
ncbi:MAG TPA: GNAT family protein [Candidatus Norongarragalinales archaeon]|jgi:RimJ/RimL family protein N-acetyltransferase|nr:GNAT family protein [Candidatus Norongarragalinales archaeon]